MTLPETNLGGGNPNIFDFHPEPWGRFPIWRAYFSDGWFNHQPVTASLPLKIGRLPQKGNEKVFQASIFRGELLVSGRVTNSFLRNCWELEVHGVRYIPSRPFIKTGWEFTQKKWSDVRTIPPTEVQELYGKFAQRYCWWFRNPAPVDRWSGWWFQRFFIFTPIWGRFPFWLIFFRWVETTNQ